MLSAPPNQFAQPTPNAALAPLAELPPPSPEQPAGHRTSPASSFLSISLTRPPLSICSSRSPTTSPWMAAARARVRHRNRATTASPRIRRVPAIPVVAGPPQLAGAPRSVPSPYCRAFAKSPSPAPASAASGSYSSSRDGRAPGSARLRQSLTSPEPLPAVPSSSSPAAAAPGSCFYIERRRFNSSSHGPRVPTQRAGLPNAQPACQAASSTNPGQARGERPLNSAL